MKVIFQRQVMHNQKLYRSGDVLEVDPAEYELIKNYVIITSDKMPSPKRMKKKPAKNIKRK